MPITSYGSYLTTAQQFIAHWTAVNATLGANPLLLRGTYTLANFTTDRAALQTAITALEPLINTLDAAIADRDIKKAAIKPRVLQFRNAVKHYLAGNPLENGLPLQPSPSAIESKFLKPLDDVAALWVSVNAIPATGAGSVPGFTPPLTLLGSYALAAFNTDLAALRTVYLSVTNAQISARIARERRDVLLPNLRLRMEQYRKAILALYSPTDPFVLSLPVVFASSTATPEPVSASGEWDFALQEGVITIIPSTNPDLDYYSVRSSPPPYSAKEEKVIGQIKSNQKEFRTTSGLAASGSELYARVYVVLKSGNEKGSTTIKIVRP